MNTPRIEMDIPEGVCFADLRLRWNHETGDLDYEPGVMAAVMHWNGLDAYGLMNGTNARAIAGLVLAVWYGTHRRCGGAPDRVMEQLIAEANAQETFGEGRVQHGFGVLH